uniref:Uncharacterized protein n=1 Tax=Triticum urartu TaxID=4572 RepID=A0A8R7PF92_TRIUA
PNRSLFLWDTPVDPRRSLPPHLRHGRRIRHPKPGPRVQLVPLLVPFPAAGHQELVLELPVRVAGGAGAGCSPSCCRQRQRDPRPIGVPGGWAFLKDAPGNGGTDLKRDCFGSQAEHAEASATRDFLPIGGSTVEQGTKRKQSLRGLFGFLDD